MGPGDVHDNRPDALAHCGCGIFLVDCNRCLVSKVTELDVEIEELKAEVKTQMRQKHEAFDQRDKSDLQIRQNEEASQSRKARCVEKCNHPADFVCDYEDGTSHCLECVAEKFWQLEDILSGKHNVHTYHGALETIAHPERFLTKYDPVQVAKDALKEKRKCLDKGLMPNHGVLECELEEGHDMGHRKTINGHPFGW